MKLRSLLFVPGDRPDRMEKALGAGADALILDLEDAVAPSAKQVARHEVAHFLNQHNGSRIFVRVNPQGSPDHDKDLNAILPSHPDGIVLPKSEGGASVTELAKSLSERGNVTAQILAIGTETPSAIFGLGTYSGAKRLIGLTGRGGSAGRGRRHDGPGGGWPLHAALRARPFALPVRRGGGRGAADRDGLSGLSRSGGAGGLCGAGAAGRVPGDDGNPSGAGSRDQ